VNVEIWSDIACPWCAVGMRRFETALARFEHRDDVSVTWRSFELDPSAPAEHEEDLEQRLAHKIGGSVAQVRAMQDNLTALAAAEGLEFRFDRARTGNTLDAHRLVHLAADHGLQHEANERLLKAHFEEGALVSDHATLRRLAADVGLPDAEVVDTLASRRYEEAVRDDQRTGQALGVNGVPCFVVDRQIGISGAQSPEVLLDLMQRGWDSAHPPVAIVADGGSCGADGS
jgi:predicted DsbA family dithiol-disulfide isomerase